LQNKFSPAVPLIFPRLQEFRTLRMSSSEFGIYPKLGQALTAYDFIYRGHKLDKQESGGERLVVYLEGRQGPLDVTLTYTTEPSEPWMRKSLRIAPHGGGT
jgi:hypothetical protein